MQVKSRAFWSGKLGLLPWNSLDNFNVISQICRRPFPQYVNEELVPYSAFIMTAEYSFVTWKQLILFPIGITMELGKEAQLNGMVYKSLELKQL